MGLLGVGLLLAAAAASPGMAREAPLVGAHYHVWYPQNFEQGTLRRRLAPPQAPVAGHYRSTDPSVAAQHIAWCSAYGIDFLILDWWPRRPAQNAAIDQGFLRAPNIGDIRFCIFYEAWDLNFDPATGATTFTPPVAEAFLADIDRLADSYFSHPSYLRVEGRPVLILYLSRTFTGRYAEAIRAARRRLAARGLEPFLVGDEMFWGVMAGRDSWRGRPRPAVGPQRRRLRLFDAVFGYNLYDWSRPQHAGYAAESEFLEDAASIMDTFRRAVPGVALIPDVLPGYNDRGVRAGEDHYAIPRQFAEGAGEGSFFAAFLDRVALPRVDPDLNMLFITSWNEWNEDTAIEPLRQAPPTRRDDSDTGYALTQGYAYPGHGMRYLELLRDRVVAVAGRVTAADGTAAPGAPLTARQADRCVALRADSRGCYRVRRGDLVPGNAELTPGDGHPVRVRVLADRTVLLPLVLPGAPVQARGAGASINAP